MHGVAWGSACHLFMPEGYETASNCKGVLLEVFSAPEQAALSTCSTPGLDPVCATSVRQNLDLIRAQSSGHAGAFESLPASSLDPRGEVPKNSRLVIGEPGALAERPYSRRHPSEATSKHKNSTFSDGISRLLFTSLPDT